MGLVLVGPDVIHVVRSVLEAISSLPIASLVEGATGRGKTTQIRPGEHIFLSKTGSEKYYTIRS